MKRICRCSTEIHCWCERIDSRCVIKCLRYESFVPKRVFRTFPYNGNGVLCGYWCSHWCTSSIVFISFSLFCSNFFFFILAVVDECGVGFSSIKTTREIPKQNNQNKKDSVNHMCLRKRFVTWITLYLYYI